MTLSNIILVSTIACTALMAGLFFAYACSVMPGLRLMPDEQFVGGMRSINRAIQNPLFFLVFFGALLLLPLNSYLQHSHSPAGAFRLFLSAFIIYFLGAFCVTVLGNIPLNNALDKVDVLAASKNSLQQSRVIFEKPWIILNWVRTFSSFMSLILLVCGCLRANKA